MCQNVLLGRCLSLRGAYRESPQKERPIKKSRFSGEQIIAVLKQLAAGRAVMELSREYGW